jgi:DNA modification methylase
MTVFLLTECIIFDVYLTLASWSRQPLKNIRLSQQNYLEIGTEPYPCFFSLNIMHEYILIFQNEGQMQIPLERLSEDFIKKVSWSVWEMGVSYTKGHPAPFPYELPSRLIQLYTVEGETVLDPFGGSGTTMKVARNLKRNSFLYEINSEYIDLIKENVGWNSSLDSDTRYEIKIRKSITR